MSRKELKIVQLVEKKKGKTEKIKYPPIPAKDVTYAVQVLAVLVLNFQKQSTWLLWFR